MNFFAGFIVLIFSFLSFQAQAEAFISEPVFEYNFNPFDRKALFAYLQTTKQRKDYNRLYRKFKSHPDLKNSQTALKRAIAFFVKHKEGEIQCHPDLQIRALRNKKYILMTDYTIPLRLDKDNQVNRFFILYLNSGKVTSSPAVHGYGSDKGCPLEFQILCNGRTRCLLPFNIMNEYDSGATSKGFYITAETYRSDELSFKLGTEDTPYSKKGSNAVRLDGLQYRINHEARGRGIVLHRASYYKNTCSRSAGCPAIKPAVFEKYKEELDRGALLYIHTIEDQTNKLPNCIL